MAEKKCTHCSTATIPFAAHESDMARSERQNRRLWIVILVLIVALVASNCAWIVYESRMETEEVWTQDVKQFGTGYNNFIGGDYGGTKN